MRRGTGREEGEKRDQDCSGDRERRGGVRTWGDGRKGRRHLRARADGVGVGEEGRGVGVEREWVRRAQKVVGASKDRRRKG